MVRFMANCKVLSYSIDKMKRHTGDLASMVVTIPDWKARYHHVSVTYGFDLSKRKMEKKGMRSLVDYALSQKLEDEIEFFRLK